MSLEPEPSPFTPRRMVVIAVVAVALIALVAGSVLAAGILSPSPPKRSPARVAAPSPTAAATPTPTPTPTATPTATPAPTPPPSAVAALTCKIAVSSGRPGSGGWVTLPGGGFSPDPASAVNTPSGGFWGLTHVLAQDKWVPVPRAWVRPDGRAYGYTDWDYSGELLRVVYADGNQMRVTLSTLPWTTATGARLSLSWRILSVESDGVYVVPDSYQTAPGLVRVDYAGGITTIARTGFYQAAGNGGAYGTATASVPPGAANTIFYLDFASGKTTNVFTQPSKATTIVGFDTDDNPVFVAGDGKQFEVWYLGNKIMRGDQPGPNSEGTYVSSAVGDSHGLWLGTSRGLYLYTKAAGLEKASTVSGVIASSCRD